MVLSPINGCFEIRAKVRTTKSPQFPSKLEMLTGVCLSLDSKSRFTDPWERSTSSRDIAERSIDVVVWASVYQVPYSL